MWKNNIRADEPLTLCKYTLIQSQENLLSKSMGMCWVKSYALKHSGGWSAHMVGKNYFVKTEDAISSEVKRKQ